MFFSYKIWKYNHLQSKIINDVTQSSNITSGAMKHLKDKQNEKGLKSDRSKEGRKQEWRKDRQTMCKENRLNGLSSVEIHINIWDNLSS